MQISIVQSLLIALAAVTTPAHLLAAKLPVESAVHYRELGLLYRDQGRWPEAIAALQKAVELDSDNLAGRVNLGWILHLAGRDREAAAVLQQTIQRDPLHVPTFNALGIVYLVNDDLVGAVTAHSWAALLDPKDEIAYYNLSLAFQRLKQYDWAIDTAKKAAELEPDNPHPFVALAIAQWDKGEKVTAQQTYQQAIEIDSRYSDSSFLNYLDEAGFSHSQIEKSQQVLKTLP